MSADARGWAYAVNKRTKVSHFVFVHRAVERARSACGMSWSWFDESSGYAVMDEPPAGKRKCRTCAESGWAREHDALLAARDAKGGA